MILYAASGGAITLFLYVLGAQSLAEGFGLIFMLSLLVAFPVIAMRGN